MTTLNSGLRIAVSDVDGTIVRRSLVLSHAAHLHREGAVDLGDLPDRWLAAPKDEHLISTLAEAYREAIVGHTADGLDADGYISSVVADPGNFYSILDRLRALQVAGTEVVLVSGSPGFLVDRFASHYGFSSVGSNYITDPHGRFTGECIGMFSGGAKREYLAGLGLDRYAEVLAFGDTRSDEPLFDSATYSVLVEPTEETRVALLGKVNEVIHD